MAMSTSTSTSTSMSTSATMSFSSVTFEWAVTIPEDHDKTTYSPEFTTIDGVWCLCLNFKLPSVDLLLHPKKVESNPTVRFKLWARQGEILLSSTHIVYKFTDNKSGFGHPEIVKRPSETKIITFGVKIFAPSNTFVSPAHSDPLFTIFNDAKTSDVEFYIQGRCTYAHKAILIARSPYFRAKFKEFKEGSGEIVLSGRQRIDIPEDHEAFPLILRHLYTGYVSLPLITVEAKKALDTFHEYMAEELVLATEESVIRLLSKDNVLGVFFDYGYKYSNLKRECIECIAKNYKKLRNTEEFKKGLMRLVNEGGNGEPITELFLAVNK